MKNITMLFLIFVFLSCSTKSNNSNMLDSQQKIQEIEIFSVDEFYQIAKNKNFSDEELIIFFDSLITKNFDILKDICYSKENMNMSENLRMICSIYQVYILLCNNDFDLAKKQIEKLQTAEVVHYQFDKFISFYYWGLEKYDAANWNADFYLFRYHNEKKRTIKRSASKIKFKMRFLTDSSFKYLNKRLSSVKK